MLQRYTFLSCENRNLSQISINHNDSFFFALCLAHYKVPQSIQGQQEATSAASGNGQVFALPDPGWHPLPTC